ncbi:MAG TPA: alpha/beta fold hydrolase [Microbacterium sp.]|nr:alpha/beta fold hydrolase [Microbacterium sp.]
MNRSASPARALDPGAGMTAHRITLPDGRVLRAVLAGDGAGPLVVFEAGMSAPAASWLHTQREIAAHARTLSYDRAGHRGSDPDPQPRTLERMTDDLENLLDALGERGPLVLVGHSWGGPILRVFAERHPDRVAGVVFVDATVAEAMSPVMVRAQRASFVLLIALLRVGGRRLIQRMALPHGVAPQISAADEAIMWRDYACVPAMKAGRQEARQISAALPLLRRLQTAGTPDVPVVCLLGGRADGRRGSEVRRAFRETAAALMADAPQGSVVIAEDAGHLVPQEAPETTRDTILGVLRRA